MTATHSTAVRSRRSLRLGLGLLGLLDAGSAVSPATGGSTIVGRARRGPWRPRPRVGRRPSSDWRRVTSSEARSAARRSSSGEGVRVGHGRLNGSGRGCARSRAPPASASGGGASTTRACGPRPTRSRSNQASAATASRTRSVPSVACLDVLDGVGLGHPRRRRARARARPAGRRHRAGTRRRRRRRRAARSGRRAGSPRRSGRRGTAARHPARWQWPSTYEAAVLRVHEVRVDVALGARVPAVGVVVEVRPGGARSRPVRSTSSMSAPPSPRSTSSTSAGVDAEHRQRAWRRRAPSGPVGSVPGSASTDAPAVRSATAWSGVSRCGDVEHVREVDPDAVALLHDVDRARRACTAAARRATSPRGRRPAASP